MAEINLELLKKLRNETSASVSDCRRALDESQGDYKKALSWLAERSAKIAEKKADRATSEGLVESYIHAGGEVGALVELLCETDFVAKTDEFKKLAREVAMQVAAMDPKDTQALMKQEYIRDSSQTIEQLVKAAIGKLGENITIKRFHRLSVSE